MKMDILTAAVMTSSLAMFASSANAAMTTDSHGNVGYDSYEECVTAVKDGSAKFYTPYTYQTPQRQAGEATVKKMRLSEVMIPQTVINTKVTGDKDPGYGSTSRMLAQAALCLAQDISKEEVGGGFWTPASAMGNHLLARLEEHAGLSFEVVDS